MPDTNSSRRAGPQPEEPVEFGIFGRMFFSFLVITILIGGFGTWAATAELSGAVISHGTVIVDGRAKKIQHRDGGSVASINVKEGDRVSQGETLVVLDDTQMKAELAITQSQLVELRARHARLTAERGSDDAIVFPAEIANNPDNQVILNGEKRLFEDARQTRQSQKEQLSLRISQLQMESEGVSSQRQAKKKELSLIDKELDDVRALFAQKLTPATRVYALERDQTRIAGEHGALVAQEARLRGQISEIQVQIINLDQTARTEAQREVRNTEARIAELRERDVAQRDRLAHMHVRAPQAGVVHELQVHTVGGVITPAEPIMMIVPDTKALTIEIRVSPAEIDQVHVGQPVRLRFTAFNQRTTPEKQGRISYVSADVTHDAKARVDYYAANVKLEGDDTFFVSGQPILPGMPVEAFITTGKRTALSYFLKPLTDHMSRALREE